MGCAIDDYHDTQLGSPYPFGMATGDGAALGRLFTYLHSDAQIDEFIEAFVDAPLAECRRRDPKGLYRKAEAGLLRGLTGVDAPYEPPAAPELHLRTAEATAEELAGQVVAELRRRGVIG